MRLSVFNSLRLTVSLAVGLWSIGMSAVLMADPPDHKGMLERLMNPDRSQKSAYQGKSFDTGSGFSSKSFTTGGYAGIKEFESKPFATKDFEGSKKGWLSKMFPEKKLPENLGGADRDAGKKFATKNLPEKEYAGLSKKSSYSGQDAYATKDFLGKGKVQGALDNDMHLQDAVKKGLTEEEVRKLLNKPL